MKRVLSLILAALLLFSLPISAAASYSDVPAGAWYEDAVIWATEQGLMNGTGNNQFNPGGIVSRAQLVTILWRLEGEPSADAAPFTDVREGSWYETAVAWAYSHGIVTGKTAATFAPGDPLSRAQAAAIFYRYADDYRGYDTSNAADLTVFPDHGAVPAYATDAFAWANAEGLITGSQQGTEILLVPGGQTKRSQLATILRRFVDYTQRQAATAAAPYYYQQLSPALQNAYRRMDTAVNQLQPRFYLGDDLTPEEAYRVYDAYLMDHPEHFYLGNGASYYSVYENGTERVDLLIYFTDGTTAVTETLPADLKARILDQKATFEAKVREILSAIPASLPQVEKEKMIHDWLITHTRYAYDFLEQETDNSTGTPHERSAYGAIVNGSGVCEAYAEAFQVLCDRAGIYCTSIVGTASGGAHKWNAVLLDNEWYMVDTTFDDPLINGEEDDALTGEPHSVLHYLYFNQTAAATQTHIPDQPFPAPHCTGTKYSYENHFNK